MTDRAAPSAAPVWFGSTGRPLFGWVHTPADGRASGAVVLCPPLAREGASVHDTYRALAERLAQAGLVAVRFDYEGTGDSAGTDEGPGRVEAWSASVDHAVTLARSTGVGRVGLVGMRMGAVLAAAAAERLAGVDALVAWDPCWSGRSFVRQQRAISLLRFWAEEAGVGPGELPGFRFDEPTISAIGALRLPVSGIRAARRALVLTRPDATVPAAARAELAPPAVTWGEAVGQSELVDVEPVCSRVPTRTMTQVVHWLAAALGGERVLHRPVGAAEAIVLGQGDRLIEERCRRLGPSGLFGIETAPAGDAGGPVVIMANSGTDSHVGPNRLWVDLARQLAARGLRSLRFDLSGIGDSPTRPGQPAAVSYAPDAIDDLCDVAAAVSPDDPSNVVLVGLCSSAYLSLEGALALLPRGVAAINPIFRFTPPEMAWGPMDERRRICRPLTSAVRLFRAVPCAPLRDRLRSAAWRCANLVAGKLAPGHWMDELISADVDVFCIGGETELQPLLGVDHHCGSADGGCRIDVRPGLDHALLYSPDRDEVTAALLQHLTDRFAPAPAGIGPGDRSPHQQTPAAPSLVGGGR